MTATQIKYLIAISAVSNAEGKARVVDIADKLGYSKPSVTRSVDMLLFFGYCIRNSDKTITLTHKGKEAVVVCHELERTLRQVLQDNLHLPYLLAMKEALSMLYAMSSESRDYLINIIKKGE